MAEITGSISKVSNISGGISGGISLSGELSERSHILPPTYSGPHEVTPSPEEQVLQTNGYVMADDITINPIPDCYGLITWDGSVLTVS